MAVLNALHLMLAGGAAVRRADGAVKSLAPIDAALLAFVALEGATSRERLLGLLWPEQPPESARNVLRQRLFRLRRGLGADVLAQGAELLALAPGVSHDLDDAPGELLAGLRFAECDELDTWLAAQRAALKQRRRQQQEARIDALERDGRLAEGSEIAERLVSADPLDEAAARRLMHLRYLQGERAAALAAYDRFAAALAEALDAKPAQSTRELRRRSAPRRAAAGRAARHPDQPAAPAAPRRPERASRPRSPPPGPTARLLAARRGRPGQDAADPNSQPRSRPGRPRRRSSLSRRGRAMPACPTPASAGRCGP
jgi:DNA-binding SARP family transcriptional activator